MKIYSFYLHLPLPIPPLKSSYIPFLTLFKIHDLFFHKLLLETHTHTHTSKSTSITCSVYIMLLLCIFAELLGIGQPIVLFSWEDFLPFSVFLCYLQFFWEGWVLVCSLSSICFGTSIVVVHISSCLGSHVAEISWVKLTFSKTVQSVILWAFNTPSISTSVRMLSLHTLE